VQPLLPPPPQRRQAPWRATLVPGYCGHCVQRVGLRVAGKHGRRGNCACAGVRHLLLCSLRAVHAPAETHWRTMVPASACHNMRGGQHTLLRSSVSRSRTFVGASLPPCWHALLRAGISATLQATGRGGKAQPRVLARGHVCWAAVFSSNNKLGLRPAATPVKQLQ